MLVLAGFFWAGGDIIFKFWTIYKKPLFYVGGIILYILGTVFLVESFKYKNIVITSFASIIFNLIFLIIANKFIFKEELRRPEIAGIFIGIVAVYMMLLGE